MGETFADIGKPIPHRCCWAKYQSIKRYELIKRRVPISVLMSARNAIIKRSLASSAVPSSASPTELSCSYFLSIQRDDFQHRGLNPKAELARVVNSWFFVHEEFPRAASNIFLSYFGQTRLFVIELRITMDSRYYIVPDILMLFTRATRL